MQAGAVCARTSLAPMPQPRFQEEKGNLPAVGTACSLPPNHGLPLAAIEIIHLLVHFPGRSKETGSSRVFHVGGRGPSTWSINCLFRYSSKKLDWD